MFPYKYLIIALATLETSSAVIGGPADPLGGMGAAFGDAFAGLLSAQSEAQQIAVVYNGIGMPESTKFDAAQLKDLEAQIEVIEK